MDSLKSSMYSSRCRRRLLRKNNEVSLTKRSNPHHPKDDLKIDYLNERKIGFVTISRFRITKSPKERTGVMANNERCEKKFQFQFQFDKEPEPEPQTRDSVSSTQNREPFFYFRRPESKDPRPAIPSNVTFGDGSISREDFTNLFDKYLSNDNPNGRIVTDSLVHTKQNVS